MNRAYNRPQQWRKQGSAETLWEQDGFNSMSSVICETMAAVQKLKTVFLYACANACMRVHAHAHTRAHTKAPKMFVAITFKLLDSCRVSLFGRQPAPAALTSQSLSLGSINLNVWPTISPQLASLPLQKTRDISALWWRGADCPIVLQSGSTPEQSQWWRLLETLHHLNGTCS